MSHLMLGAFYDAVNLSVGPILTYTFFFLLVIEFLYVSFKYTGTSDDK
ncbi:hypothetical protein [Nemorincola caseinilytica]